MDAAWMEDVVSMMSAGAGGGETAGNGGDSSSTVPLGVSHIKKEEAPFQPCSPSNSNMYSPTTTMELCGESQEGSGNGGPRSPKCLKFYDGSVAASPGSPDRQFCSSTTQSIGDSLLGRTEESMKEEDSPRRLCLVCGDVASGFHYGVASCEACKAFFKRTIQGNIEYSCPAANDCEINKRRRKACQACRFQKCLRMGMLKEGVRLDRVRGGRQKYRRNPDLPYQMQAPPPVKPTLEENKMLEVLAACEPEMLMAGPELASASDGELRTVALLSDLYDRELVGIITWAKQIPGFMELSLNDQMRLLQSTWAEILTLTLAFRSLPSSSGKLRFAHDFFLDERTAREAGAIELYQQDHLQPLQDHLQWKSFSTEDDPEEDRKRFICIIELCKHRDFRQLDLFKLCMHLVSRLERITLAKEEYLVLKALVLVNSDAHVDEFAPLKQLRDQVTSALQDCVVVLRPSTGTYHMQQLLLSLPALRQADHVIRRYWADVRQEAKVPMNKLFVEMLEAYHR